VITITALAVGQRGEGLGASSAEGLPEARLRGRCLVLPQLEGSANAQAAQAKDHDARQKLGNERLADRGGVGSLQRPKLSGEGRAPGCFILKDG
jgi:hypothetical protein